MSDSELTIGKVWGAFKRAFVAAMATWTQQSKLEARETEIQLDMYDVEKKDAIQIWKEKRAY